jgi:hypothetical protein
MRRFRSRILIRAITETGRDGTGRDGTGQEARSNRWTPVQGLPPLRISASHRAHLSRLRPVILPSRISTLRVSPDIADTLGDLDSINPVAIARGIRGLSAEKNSNVYEIAFKIARLFRHFGSSRVSGQTREGNAIIRNVLELYSCRATRNHL